MKYKNFLRILSVVLPFLPASAHSELESTLELEATNASEVLATLRTTAESDKLGNQPGVVVAINAQNPSQDAAFGFEDLYVKGSKVKYLQIPGTKPPTYRRISIRLYSKVVDPGPPAVIADEIGIFDISEPGAKYIPSNIYGRRFPLTTNGDTYFRLDDRRPDTIRYKLSVAQGSISFVAVDAVSKKPTGQPLKTSITELYILRAKQAKGLDADGDPFDGATLPSPVKETIENRLYFKIGQGGAKGATLYFAVDNDGELASETPALIK
jgi:hypothetical protein